MNSFDYLHQERQAQFSDSKRAEVEAYAKRKNYSIATCVNCREPFAEKDTRKELHLCSRCESGRAALTIYMKNHKIHTLTPADLIKISQSRTVRFGRNNPK